MRKDWPKTLYNRLAGVYKDITLTPPDLVAVFVDTGGVAKAHNMDLMIIRVPNIKQNIADTENTIQRLNAFKEKLVAGLSPSSKYDDDYIMIALANGDVAVARPGDGLQRDRVTLTLTHYKESKESWLAMLEEDEAALDALRAAKAALEAGHKSLDDFKYWRHVFHFSGNRYLTLGIVTGGL